MHGCWSFTSRDQHNNILPLELPLHVIIINLYLYRSQLRKQFEELLANRLCAFDTCFYFNHTWKYKLIKWSLMVRNWFNSGVKSSHSNALKITGVKLKGENYFNGLDQSKGLLLGNGFNKSRSRWDRFDPGGHRCIAIRTTLRWLNI